MPLAQLDSVQAELLWPMGCGSGFLVGEHRCVGGPGPAFGLGEAHGLHPGPWEPGA